MSAVLRDFSMTSYFINFLHFRLSFCYAICRFLHPRANHSELLSNSQPIITCFSAYLVEYSQRCTETFTGCISSHVRRFFSVCFSEKRDNRSIHVVTFGQRDTMKLLLAGCTLLSCPINVIDIVEYLNKKLTRLETCFTNQHFRYSALTFETRKPQWKDILCSTTLRQINEHLFSVTGA